MKWTKDQSIKLSILCVYVFAAVLLVADVLGFRWVPAYCAWRSLRPGTSGRMLFSLYNASVYGWACLWALYTLLRNISRGEVFVPANVKLLRAISWCCALAALVFFGSGFYYAPFFLITVAAAFMMLIVRVVKNVFQQAVEMKDELDLTI